MSARKKADWSHRMRNANVEFRPSTPLRNFQHIDRISRNMQSVLRGTIALLFIALTALPCAAQFNSSIRGTVQDPTGSSIAGARASLTNLGTNISTSTITDSAGVYDFRSLPAGEYRLQVQATGFANASIHSILQTDESLNVPVKMIISGGATIVDVQSEAPLLDTADSRIQTTLPQNQIDSLTASPRQGMDLSNSQTSRSGQVSETHTFSPKMLNEAAFGYLQIEGIAGTSGQFDVPISTIQGQGQHGSSKDNSSERACTFSVSL
jgi:hypothetical protein